jgi:hypothetical protein
MCTGYLHYIHSPTASPPHWCWPHTPQNLFYPSVLWFCRRKKRKRKHDIFVSLS